jgi:2-methylcitrate dehydratase PrpD
MNIEKDRMIIEEWARHIAGSDFRVLDNKTIEQAKRRILDVTGCIIGGANAPGCSMVLELVKEWGGREEATVAIYGVKAPAHNAAMVNCIMGRSFDYGPVIAYVEGKPVICHISESTIPTALAMAEWRGATGKEFLTALVTGDDIIARMLAAGDKGPPQGWDHTGIANVFGTTAVAGKLLGLNEHQIIHAWGIALNQMGGTMQSLYDGAQTFKLPQGLAARNGIFSAELAGKGYTGIKDPLCSKYGYFALYSPNYDAGILTRGLGVNFYSDSCFKMFPCCGAIQPTVECTINLVRDHDIKVSELDEVTINVTPAHLEQPLGQPFKIGDFPQGNAAFNLRYLVASILIRKSLKPSHFTEQYIRDPQVFNLSRQINITGTIPNEKHTTTADVRVRMKDGREFLSHVEAPRGSPLAEPITKSEIEQKFRENVDFSRTVTPEKAEKALDMINNLEDVKDIGQLMRLLV